MSKLVQAKNISDEMVLDVIRSRRAAGLHTGPNHVMAAMPAIPYKVVLAKITGMDKRGVIEACGCGCSSPMWELIEGRPAWTSDRRPWARSTCGWLSDLPTGGQLELPTTNT